ncbi:MAG TPA: sulfur transferase domain-containing protein [Tepidisphaeraceae bacterium]|jgi:uncharacterized protein (TIGR01244 family)|nr:sulfur transferase domain-containing protein [Tepidisphaeraceae bacterium]
MSKKKLFALSTTLTTCAMAALLYVQRPGSRFVPVLVSESGGSVYVSSQISLRDVGYVARSGMRTIVDMRPDGEAADEPSSRLMERFAKGQGIDFSYIPIPHESIPPATVTALGDVLSSSQRPAVLYCRTGRRAVRTFALFEASRHDGPGADAILAMVKNAGFSAEDLRPEIVNRIAARAAVSEAKQ